jgi:hypothetical protein
LDGGRDNIALNRTFAGEKIVDLIGVAVGRNKLCHGLAVLGYNHSLP